MSFDLVLGIILVISSIGVSTAIIIYCMKHIDRISRRKLSSLREIEQEFRHGR